jgi:LuxR family transcriptional regulator of csgAB operon
MENFTVPHSSPVSDPVRREFIQLVNARIYVVGNRAFQNGLLVHFLQQSTGLPCEIVDRVRHVSPHDGVNSVRRQILWDFLGKDPEAILAEIETEGRGVLDRHLVALFNVRRGMGIEEKSVALGVRGFFYEQDPLDLFLRGVRAVFAGELWLSRQVMTRCILDQGRANPCAKEPSILTARETEILQMVVMGSTNDQIAEKLAISPHTVKTHLYNIFKKIDVPNRFQAALWASKNL